MEQSEFKLLLECGNSRIWPINMTRLRLLLILIALRRLMYSPFTIYYTQIFSMFVSKWCCRQLRLIWTIKFRARNTPKMALNRLHVVLISDFDFRTLDVSLICIKQLSISHFLQWNAQITHDSLTDWWWAERYDRVFGGFYTLICN